MASSSTPIEIVLRMEPEELRERRGTLRLKACPFCGGAVEPRWAPWIDGEECWEVGHVDTPAAVAAKCPLEMGGYADLDEFERSWNAPGLPARLPDNSADAPQGSVIAHAHTRTHTQLRIRTRAQRNTYAPAYLHTCAPAYSHTYI